MRRFRYVAGLAEVIQEEHGNISALHENEHGDIFVGTDQGYVLHLRSFVRSKSVEADDLAESTSSEEKWSKKGQISSSKAEQFGDGASEEKSPGMIADADAGSFTSYHHIAAPTAANLDSPHYEKKYYSSFSFTFDGNKSSPPSSFSSHSSVHHLPSKGSSGMKEENLFDETKGLTEGVKERGIKALFSNEENHRTKRAEEEEEIYTVSLGAAKLSVGHEAVTQLHYAREMSLLWVLCDTFLSIWSIGSEEVAEVGSSSSSSTNSNYSRSMRSGAWRSLDVVERKSYGSRSKRMNFSDERRYGGRARKGGGSGNEEQLKGSGCFHEEEEEGEREHILDRKIAQFCLMEGMSSSQHRLLERYLQSCSSIPTPTMTLPCTFSFQKAAAPPIPAIPPIERTATIVTVVVLEERSSPPLYINVLYFTPVFSNNTVVEGDNPHRGLSSTQFKKSEEVSHPSSTSTIPVMDPTTTFSAARQMMESLLLLYEVRVNFPGLVWSITPGGEFMTTAVVHWRDGLVLLLLGEDEEEVEEKEQGQREERYKNHFLEQGSTKNGSGINKCKACFPSYSLFPCEEELALIHFVELPLPFETSPSFPQRKISHICVSRDGELAFCVEETIFSCSLGELVLNCPEEQREEVMVGEVRQWRKQNLPHENSAHAYRRFQSEGHQGGQQGTSLPGFFSCSSCSSSLPLPCCCCCPFPSRRFLPLPPLPLPPGAKEGGGGATFSSTLSSRLTNPPSSSNRTDTRETDGRARNPPHQYLFHWWYSQDVATSSERADLLREKENTITCSFNTLLSPSMHGSTSRSTSSSSSTSSRNSSSTSAIQDQLDTPQLATARGGRGGSCIFHKGFSSCSSSFSSTTASPSSIEWWSRLRWRRIRRLIPHEGQFHMSLHYPWILQFNGSGCVYSTPSLLPLLHLKPVSFGRVSRPQQGKMKEEEKSEMGEAVRRKMKGKRREPEKEDEEQQNVRIPLEKSSHTVHASPKGCSFTLSPNGKYSPSRVSSFDTAESEGEYPTCSSSLLSIFASDPFTIPLPGVHLVVPSRSSYGKIFLANDSTIWMLAIPSLEEQWDFLVKEDHMYTALQWCHREQSLQRSNCSSSSAHHRHQDATTIASGVQPRRPHNRKLKQAKEHGIASGSLFDHRGCGSCPCHILGSTMRASPCLPLGMMESQLRLQAGFHLLFKGNIEEGLYFFKGSGVDIREVILFIPECIPANVIERSGNVSQDGSPVRTAYSVDYWNNYTFYAYAYFHSATNDHLHSKTSSFKKEAQMERTYFSTLLEEAWRKGYDESRKNIHPIPSTASSRGVEPRGKLSTSPSPTPPSSAATGIDSFSWFLEDRWRRFKWGIENLLQRELYMHTLPLPQARAAAYALLVLALERRDFHAAHRLCLLSSCSRTNMTGSSRSATSSIPSSQRDLSLCCPLHVEDAAPLLESLGEFRLLATVWWCAGKKKKALFWMKKRLWLSALLSLRSAPVSSSHCPSVALYTHPVYASSASASITGCATLSSCTSSDFTSLEGVAKEESSLPLIGEVGSGWLSLPPFLQERVAQCLFYLSLGRGRNPSKALNTESVEPYPDALGKKEEGEEEDERVNKETDSSLKEKEYTEKSRTRKGSVHKEDKRNVGGSKTGGGVRSTFHCPHSSNGKETADNLSFSTPHLIQALLTAFPSSRSPCPSSSSLTSSRLVRFVAPFYSTGRLLSQKQKEDFHDLCHRKDHPHPHHFRCCGGEEKVVVENPRDGGGGTCTSGKAAVWCTRNTDRSHTSGGGGTTHDATSIPNTLSFSFVLLDHLELPALADYLHNDPQRCCIRDEEGSSLVHLALGMLALAPPFDSCSSATPTVPSPTLSSCDSKTVGSSPWTSSGTLLNSSRSLSFCSLPSPPKANGKRRPSTDNATSTPGSSRLASGCSDSSTGEEDGVKPHQEVILKCVTSALGVLLLAGCPTDGITAHGLSVVDVPFVAAPSTSSYADALVATMLSLKEVAGNIPRFSFPL